MAGSDIEALRRQLRKAIRDAEEAEYPVAVLDLYSLRECMQLLEARYGRSGEYGQDDDPMEEMLNLRDGE